MHRRTLVTLTRLMTPSIIRGITLLLVVVNAPSSISCRAVRGAPLDTILTLDRAKRLIDEPITGVSVSNDGSFFALGTRDGTLMLVSASDLTIKDRVNAGLTGVHSVSFDNNGNVLAICRRSLCIWRIQDNRLVKSEEFGLEDQPLKLLQVDDHQYAVCTVGPVYMYQNNELVRTSINARWVALDRLNQQMLFGSKGQLLRAPCDDLSRTEVVFDVANDLGSDQGPDQVSLVATLPHRHEILMVCEDKVSSIVRVLDSRSFATTQVLADGDRRFRQFIALGRNGYVISIGSEVIVRDLPHLLEVRIIYQPDKLTRPQGIYFHSCDVHSSENTTELVVGTDDGAVQVFTVGRNEEMIREAR